MTPLRRAVKRTIEIAGSRRGVVVSLEPPGVLTFREKRTRKTYSLGLGALFVRAVMADVDAEKAAKRKRKK